MGGMRKIMMTVGWWCWRNVRLSWLQRLNKRVFRLKRMRRMNRLRCLVMMVGLLGMGMNLDIFGMLG